MLGNQHGGNDFKPNTYPVTGIDSNFDKMFMFGQNEIDYFKVNDTGGVLSRHSSEEEFVACGIMYTYT